MKKSRFTEEQMVTMLREADRTSVAEVSKKYKVSDQTLYGWRKRFGQLSPADVKRLRELESENAKLKRMLAEREMAIDTLKGDQPPKVVSPQARREQVRLAMALGHSSRQACGLLGVARSMLGYCSVRAEKDAPVIAAMRTLSARYPRYGYRRIRIFLAREGHAMSPDRAYRLWRQAGLQLPKRRPRRRVATHRPRPLPPQAPNHVWAYDFVFDSCANGQQLKCLTVVDEFTAECLAIDVAGSIRSKRVIDVLARLISLHGAPTALRSDNGPEFVSHAILKWLLDSRIDTAFIDPGKPWQNGVSESFNGKFRDECLSMEWFQNRTEAKVVIGQWRCHYNQERPHSRHDYLTPVEFKALYQSLNKDAISKISVA